MTRLRSGDKPWRRVPLNADATEICWGLDLWNGQKPPKAGSLSIALFDPPVGHEPILPSGLDTDRIVLTGPERSHVDADSSVWSGILTLARCLGDELGGMSIVTSHELWQSAEEEGLSNGCAAAYAAFWGLDRSGGNRHYRWLSDAGIQPPHAMILCPTWEACGGLDMGEVQGLIRLTEG